MTNIDKSALSGGIWIATAFVLRMRALVRINNKSQVNV